MFICYLYFVYFLFFFSKYSNNHVPKNVYISNQLLLLFFLLRLENSCYLQQDVISLDPSLYLRSKKIEKYKRYVLSE